MTKGKFKLSNAEYAIMDLFCLGYSSKEIATKLDRSIFTINSHIRNIYNKLSVANRSQAVSIYMNNIPAQKRRSLVKPAV